MDPELKNALDGIGDAFAEFKSNYNARLDDIETRQNRPGGYPQQGTHDRKKLNAALRRYITSGDDAGLRELNSMSVGSDPDGGYLVPPTMSDSMTKTLFETSPIRQLARVVEISTDAFEEPVDRYEPDAQWVAETGTRG